MIVSTNSGFHIGATAALLEQQDTLQAWAERHVRQDRDLRWILGNYVEANEPNSNGHIFPLAELVTAQDTLAGKPLNMLHREHYIIGAFAGAQLLTAEGAEIADADMPVAAAKVEHPRVEALAGLWHHRFQEEYFNIKRAHADGTLYFSMECVPGTVGCPTCDHSAAYAGHTHDSYCEHMNGATAPKVLKDPVFAGGAIIIPPASPGWKRADVTAISRLIQECADEAEGVYDAVSEEMPHLEPARWEQMMGQILTLSKRAEAREFKPFERKKATEKKQALPNGGFPIKTVADLKNAIRAVGRAKDPGAAKAHIKKRARELGRPDLIPAGW